ncbi:hypothetical protein KDK77_03695 [bacterium]|nr:hypothetical protein [bacterium]
MANNGTFGYKSIFVVIVMLIVVVILVEHGARLRCLCVGEALSSMYHRAENK